MRYALVRTVDNTMLRLADDVSPNVETKPGLKWLPCPPVAAPSFNAKTDRVIGPTYTVGASEVTEVWTVQALTPAEIDAMKDTAVGGAFTGDSYKPLREILLVVVNDARATRAKLNALIDATAQSATVPKYPAGQTTPITLAQLNAAIKALL